MMKKNKQQILMIHGGMTFENNQDYLKYLKTREISVEKKGGWVDDFEDKMSNKFEIIKPRMPLAENAKYSEWKINFERYIPFLKDNVVLIGVSLGGIFLAKYLSENNFSKQISGIFLVCPPFDNTLPGENLVGGFKLKKDLSLIEKSSKHVYLFFSDDDPIVPIQHSEKYKSKLNNSEIIILSGRGHFSVPKFPEIIKLIKNFK